MDKDVIIYAVLFCTFTIVVSFLSFMFFLSYFGVSTTVSILLLSLILPIPYLLFLLFFNLGVKIRGGQYNKDALGTSILVFVLFVSYPIIEKNIPLLLGVIGICGGLFCLGLLANPKKVLLDSSYTRISSIRGNSTFYFLVYNAGWERLIEKICFVLLLLDPLTLILLIILLGSSMLPTQFSRKMRKKLTIFLADFNEMNRLLDRGVTNEEFRNFMKSKNIGKMEDFVLVVP